TVFFCRRGRQLPGEGDQLAEGAGYGREADAFKRLAQIPPGGVKAGPQVGGAAAAAVGPQLRRRWAPGRRQRLPAQALLASIVTRDLLRFARVGEVFEPAGKAGVGGR